MVEVESGILLPIQGVSTQVANAYAGRTNLGHLVGVVYVVVMVPGRGCIKGVGNNNARGGGV